MSEKYPPKPIRYWLRNFDEERYSEGNERERSPILLVCGIVFGALRRLSATEWIKRWGEEWHPNNGTPAKVNDTIIVTSWVLISVGGTLLARSTQEWHWLKYAAIFWAIQIVQTTLYHNIWRKLVLPGDHPMRHGYNAVRTLIASFGNCLAIAWLFGLAYWWQGKGDFGWQFDFVLDAVYFSFVTFATVGFGDIHPERGHAFAQSLVMLQIAVSTCMLSIVISQAISAVGNVFENNPRDGASGTPASDSSINSTNVEEQVKK